MAAWLTQRRHELGVSREELGRRLDLLAHLRYRCQRGELPIPGEQSAAVVRELRRLERERRPAAERSLADSPAALWPLRAPDTTF